MRKTLILLLSSMVFLTACGGKQVIRDGAVYETELQFADNVVAEQHEQLQEFINTYCLCGTGPTLLCNAAVETWIVVESRWQWHSDMMRFNGRLIDTDPGEAPDYVEYPGLMEASCE